MTPQQSWLLAAIRGEPGITTMQLKSDLEIAIRCKVEGLDPSRLIRDLAEIEERRYVVQDVGWRPVYEVAAVQGSLFG